MKRSDMDMAAGACRPHGNMKLRIGKASVNVLDRSVMKRLGSDYCEASIWQAAAAGGRIIASDPVTLSCPDPGRIAAHEALNGLAATRSAERPRRPRGGAGDTHKCCFASCREQRGTAPPD